MDNWSVSRWRLAWDKTVQSSARAEYELVGAEKGM
jgi:hypothetical protein